MYSFLDPNGKKLVVVKITILVTLLGHVLILGYNFVETLKVLLTLNISRPPRTRSIVTSVGFLCYYLASTVEGTKRMILLKLTIFLWKSSEMLSISYKLIRYELSKVWSNQLRTFGCFSKFNRFFCSTIFWFFSMKGYEATDWSDINSSLCFHLNNTNNVVINVECLYYTSKRPTHRGIVVFFDDHNIVHWWLYVFCPPFVPLLQWR